MYLPKNINSKSPLTGRPPAAALQGGGWGRSTLVLNAISTQRQRILNEYSKKEPSEAPSLRVRKVTAQSHRTRQQVLNGTDQEGKISHISVFRTSVKVHRSVAYPKNPRPAASCRGKIDSFSDKSRSRLKFVAGNCFPLMISQFLLSYGSDNIPLDGIHTHKHLARFLDAVRRKYPGSTYMWVLEFQRRGVPHFHVFFSFPPSPEKHEFLARAWCRITKGGIHQYLVHRHENNFVKWNMKKGGYLCKYLEKAEQKYVPNNFENVGRFWGCSRNMVPSPDQWFFEDLEKIVVSQTDTITGEVHGVSIAKLLYRCLRKHHESSIKSFGIKRKSRITKTHLSTVNLPSGGIVFRQVLDYCMRVDLGNKGIASF